MDLTDWGAWRLGWDVVQGMAIAGVALYTWWQNRQRVSTKLINAVRAACMSRVDVTEGRVDRIESRLHQIDRSIDARPEFEHFDDLRRELSDSNQKLGELSARLDATTRLLDRLHEYLLTERGPKT
jgi:phosphoglycerate-specific signal transduction histidine kinase